MVSPLHRLFLLLNRITDSSVKGRTTSSAPFQHVGSSVPVLYHPVTGASDVTLVFLPRHL